VAEAAKLGFERAVVPQSSVAAVRAPAGISVSGAATLSDALESFSLLPSQRPISISGKQVHPNAH
jgi:predicted ATP-dependent serine protease